MEEFSSRDVRWAFRKFNDLTGELAEDTELAVDDKEDLLDDLRKLVEALKAPQPQPARIQRLWSRIKEIAPTVAATLSSAGVIAQILG